MSASYSLRSNNRNSLLLILFAYVFCAAGIALIGLLLFDRNLTPGRNEFFIRGEFFFLRLIWLEVLVFIGFTGGMVIPFIRMWTRRNQVGASYLVISDVLIRFVFFSIVILAATVFIKDSAYRMSYWKWHGVFQVLIAGFTAIKIGQVAMAQISHNDEIDFLPENLKTSAELAEMLRRIESDDFLAPDEKKQVKKIREWIKYSIPTAGKVAKDESYLRLVEAVESFVDEIRRHDEQFFESKIRRIESLISEVSEGIKR